MSESEPIMRIASVRGKISVSLRDKPSGCTADVRIFRVQDGSNTLVRLEKLEEWDRHVDLVYLDDGYYRITAVLRYADGSKKILEGFTEVKK